MRRGKSCPLRTMGLGLALYPRFRSPLMPWDVSLAVRGSGTHLLELIFLNIVSC